VDGVIAIVEPRPGPLVERLVEELEHVPASRAAALRLTARRRTG
jgi:hypothetical protein